MSDVIDIIKGERSTESLEGRRYNKLTTNIAGCVKPDLLRLLHSLFCVGIAATFDPPLVPYVGVPHEDKPGCSYDLSDNIGSKVLDRHREGSSHI